MINPSQDFKTEHVARIHHPGIVIPTLSPQALKRS